MTAVMICGIVIVASERDSQPQKGIDPLTARRGGKDRVPIPGPFLCIGLDTRQKPWYSDFDLI